MLDSSRTFLLYPKKEKLLEGNSDNNSIDQINTDLFQSEFTMSYKPQGNTRKKGVHTKI